MVAMALLSLPHLSHAPAAEGLGHSHHLSDGQPGHRQKQSVGEVPSLSLCAKMTAQDSSLCLRFSAMSHTATGVSPAGVKGTGWEKGVV